MKHSSHCDPTYNQAKAGIECVLEGFQRADVCPPIASRMRSWPSAPICYAPQSATKRQRRNAKSSPAPSALRLTQLIETTIHQSHDLLPEPLGRVQEREARDEPPPAAVGSAAFSATRPVPRP